MPSQLEAISAISSVTSARISTKTAEGAAYLCNCKTYVLNISRFTRSCRHNETILCPSLLIEWCFHRQASWLIRFTSIYPRQRSGRMHVDSSRSTHYNEEEISKATEAGTIQKSVPSMAIVSSNASGRLAPSWAARRSTFLVSVRPRWFPVVAIIWVDDRQHLKTKTTSEHWENQQRKIRFSDTNMVTKCGGINRISYLGPGSSTIYRHLQRNYIRNSWKTWINATFQQATRWNVGVISISAVISPLNLRQSLMNLAPGLSESFHSLQYE